MALFKAKTEEEKAREAADKIKQVLRKYGLDMEAYSLQDLQRLNSENLKRVASDIAGNRWIKAGMALSFAKGEEQAKVSYLSALVEQNWILIRQHETMIRLLTKLARDDGHRNA